MVSLKHMKVSVHAELENPSKNNLFNGVPASNFSVHMDEGNCRYADKI